VHQPDIVERSNGVSWRRLRRIRRNQTVTAGIEDFEHQQELSVANARAAGNVVRQLRRVQILMKLVAQPTRVARSEVGDHIETLVAVDRHRAEGLASDAYWVGCKVEIGPGYWRHQRNRRRASQRIAIGIRLDDAQPV